MQIAQIPPVSLFEFPPVDQLQAAPIRLALDHWRMLRGQRAFPARRDLQFRALAGVLPYMSLLRVIDGGADFEHRFMGDVQVRAFRVKMQNRKFSEIARDAPELIAASRPQFERVVSSRAPLGMRSRSGHEARDVVFTEVEGIFLPFGDADEAVDHVAVVSAYASRITRPAGAARLGQSLTSA